MGAIHRLVAARVGAVLGPLALAACAVPPPAGPSVMAPPGEGKSFDAFQQDDMTCRNYAFQMSGGAQQASVGTDRAVGTAVVGTALGAAAGAALGSLSGQMGAGAAIGGATGLLVGGAAGASGAQASAAGQQQQYDVSYTQCMYSKGDTVQSAPPAAYAGYGGYGGGYPVYGGYPGYGGGYYAPPVVYAPSVIVGGGWGGGWGNGWNRGWNRGYGGWNRGYGGWRR